MTVASVSRPGVHGLPPPLATAQAAIDLPEVQQMLRSLSAHGLGIFMPHMHDDTTGEFQPLPDELMQVESGLAVSFQGRDAVAAQAAQFLPVGWVWRAGASTVAAACEMVIDEGLDEPGDGKRPVKHKMPAEEPTGH